MIAGIMFILVVPKPRFGLAEASVSLKNLAVLLSEILLSPKKVIKIAVLLQVKATVSSAFPAHGARFMPLWRLVAVAHDAPGAQQGAQL